MGARSIWRSFAQLSHARLLLRLEKQQPNTVSMFRLKHEIRTCLVSLATTAASSICSCCCCCCKVVIMEVKRRAKMKTSLQFNVRTWHSAAGRWPFRYSKWCSLCYGSLSHSLSLALYFLLLESVTRSLYVFC